MVQESRPCSPLGPLDGGQPAVFLGWARLGWSRGWWPGLRFSWFLSVFLLNRYADSVFGTVIMQEVLVTRLELGENPPFPHILKKAF